MTGHRSLDWVLAMAPYRRDADYLETLLSQYSVPVRRGTGTQDLEALLDDRPGVLIATHEALNPEVLEIVRGHLVAQPDWSEMPIVILLDRLAPHSRIRTELAQAWPRSRQLYYQRPVATLELISGVQSGLLARQRQRDVRDHIEREIELRHELNHRVKNILASISSIFEMTRRRAVSVDQLAQDFSSRLAALADVHAAVYEANGEPIELARVADLTFEPYRTGGQHNLVSRGPAVFLLPQAATTLALCLHELATNALKYGALSDGNGRIELDWTVSPEDSLLTIRWVESGGPPVSAPSRSGYGTRYIRAALQNLFGTAPSILFHPEGLRCVVEGPVSRVSAKHPNA